MATKPSKTKPGTFDFATAMAELEEITAYLESDGAQIELAVEKYKRGIELSAQIKAYLLDTQNTIENIGGESSKNHS